MINHFTHELSDKSCERCHCLIRRKKHVGWRENVNAVWIPLPFSRKIQTYFIHTVKLSKIAQKKCTYRRKRLIKSSTAFYHVMITWVAKALPKWLDQKEKNTWVSMLESEGMWCVYEQISDVQWVIQNSCLEILSEKLSILSLKAEGSK